MRAFFHFILLFTCIGLISCSITPVKQSVSTTQTPSPPYWGDRVEVLSNIQNWDLNALIAIRANATRDAGSANMKWIQTKHTYTIVLFGPLGSNAVKLTGMPGKVSLETADGKKFAASTPEALLWQQSGWNLPVSNLLYWIRGLPVPKIPAQKTFDKENRLNELSQQGWTIHYVSYKKIQQIDLPEKIVLSNAQVNVKIIVKNWQF